MNLPCQIFPAICIPALIFSAGLAAGFINVMAGAGSALTLGLMIWLGIDGSIANGTNRFGLIIQNLSGVVSFKKESHSDFKESLKLSLLTLPGALIGAVAAVKIPDLWFQRILGVMCIFILVTLILPKTPDSKIIPSKKSWLIFPSMIAIGFYGGFIQVGVGFLIMAALRHIEGLSLVKTNMHKLFIVLFYTIPVTIIFGMSGKIQWLVALYLSCGYGLGSWLSVKVSIAKGETAVKIALGVALIIMAVKFLWG